MTARVVSLMPRKRARRTMPVRLPNAKLRTREYLTPTEVKALIGAAGRRGRYGQRDACLILLAYRHGLRVSEAVSLKWADVELRAGHLHVHRVKNGTPSTHPMQGDELRALRQLRRDWPEHGGFVFLSERAGPITAAPAAVRTFEKSPARMSSLGTVKRKVEPMRRRKPS